MSWKEIAEEPYYNLEIIVSLILPNKVQGPCTMCTKNSIWVAYPGHNGLITNAQLTVNVLKIYNILVR